MTGPAKSNLHGSKPSGIVLAGGQSRRLGMDRASEQLSGEALIRRVIHLVSPLTSETNVVMANLTRGETLPLNQMESVAVDIYPVCGFVGDISRGCRLPAHNGLVVACGMPLLNSELLTYLNSLREGYEAVVPVLKGRREPTHALYSKSACHTSNSE